MQQILNLNMKEVVKKKVIKMLYAGIIYLIFLRSLWVTFLFLDHLLKVGSVISIKYSKDV